MPWCRGRRSPETLFVDLPVVERHAVLAGQDPEDLLDLCGTGRRDCLTPEGSGQVVDGGGSQAAVTVGEIDAGQLLRPAARAARRPAPLTGLRSRVASAAVSAAFCEVAPRASIAASMSTLRLENARSTAFGTSRSSLRPLRRMSQARPSGASSARKAER